VVEVELLTFQVLVVDLEELVVVEQEDLDLRHM
jgi:hypothetical protein